MLTPESDEPPQPGSSRGFAHHKANEMTRLSGRHFPVAIPTQPGKTKAMRKCVVCNSRGVRKETRYMCHTCLSTPALCVTPCFEIFHTQEDYVNCDLYNN